ncbi:MAG: GNAT family N-acetyltransferase [Actinomycetota bacterium]|nr:GNAT family N-acetyltransferase [Actinomycetota bacterium]
MTADSSEPAKIKLRRLRRDDSDLAEVAGQLNRTEEWEDFDNRFSAHSLSEFLQDEDHIYLLAYVGSDLAGAAHAYLLQHPAGHLVVYIDEVDTAKPHRRQGVATALMNELLLWSRKRGAKEAWLGTEDDNEPAKALYRKLNPHEEELGWIFTYNTEPESSVQRR